MAVAMGLAGVVAVAVALPLLAGQAFLADQWTRVEAVRAGQAIRLDDLLGLEHALGRLRLLPETARSERLAADVAARRFDRPAELAAWRRVLRHQPGVALGWMRLAQLSPAGPMAAHALRLSALTNAFEFDMTPRRVDLGLRLWPAMDDEDRQAFGRLVRALWRWEPGRLAMVAARYGAFDQIVPYLDGPEAVAYFRRSYAVHRANPVTPYPYGG